MDTGSIVTVVASIFGILSTVTLIIKSLGDYRSSALKDLSERMDKVLAERDKAESRAAESAEKLEQVLDELKSAHEQLKQIGAQNTVLQMANAAMADKLDQVSKENHQLRDEISALRVLVEKTAT